MYVCWRSASFGFALYLTVSVVITGISQAQDSTFPSETKLVLVPAVVTDKSGKHQTGLPQDAFVVRQDGRGQSIAIFQEIHASSAPVKKLRGEGGKFSNYTLDAEFRNITLILIDLLNTPFGYKVRARDTVVNFLREPSNGIESVGVLYLDRGGPHLVGSLTDDPERLAEALSHVQVAGGTVGPPDNILLTLSALDAIAKAFSGLPGRKALVWASTGFPYSGRMLCNGCSASRQRDFQSDYDQTWQTLNDAQIAVYPVDMQGLTQGTFVASRNTMLGPAEVPGLAADAGRQKTFDAFADKTGGTVFRDSNDMSAGFRRAAEDSGSYYMLGFYLGHDHLKPGWHKLSVSVRAPGASVRARSGFFINLPKEHARQPPEQEIRQALSAPIDFTGVPITAQWGEVSAANGKQKVKFKLIMPANFASIDERDGNHLSLTIAAVAFAEGGKVAGEVSQKIDSHLKPEEARELREHGLTYANSLQVAPGDYVVRFVVRDNLDSRLGTLGIPLQIAPK